MKYKIFLLLLFILSTFSLAQTGGNFSMKKSIVASGGGQSFGANFQVTGTIGQTAVSSEITGGNFVLTGGFWQNSDIIFINGFEN